jgi:hypothetical protein
LHARFDRIEGKSSQHTNYRSGGGCEPHLVGYTVASHKPGANRQNVFPLSEMISYIYSQEHTRLSDELTVHHNRVRLSLGVMMVVEQDPRAHRGVWAV